MNTYHIHIEGQVQGVGFRPFVYKEAIRRGLAGWVNNTVDGVHVEFNAEPEAATEFYRTLTLAAAPLSRITAHRMKPVAFQEFEAFTIIHSDADGAASLLLTPDFAMCEDCRRELFTLGDRRFHYPFITCTNCGPRYSIIQDLPYDRERTTMDPFLMCPACAAEYDDPLDRRYYSQTNSCGRCGVGVALYDATGRCLASDYEGVIDQAVAAIREGAIIAVKGIGGYLLCCSAADAEVLSRLRDRKARPSKPFALMYPSLDVLRGDVFLRDEEAGALLSPESPIVLLPVRPAPASLLALEGVAPGLQQIGVMLPYAPLFALVMDRLQQPVVATSANMSNSPIIFEDERAVKELFSLADLLLTNDRHIAVPQDDSVVRFTPFGGERIVLRRSRGMAPTFIRPDLDLPPSTILAMGAALKSTFTLLHQRNTYVSQYLGDLESFDTQHNFQHTLEHFLGLFRAQPERVIIDKHPGYFATQLGLQLAANWEVTVAKVQHHEAHFAAVLGEHQLLATDEPILGVVWDGTGLGDDGQIWGGEFFEYDGRHISRSGHFEYFPFILGDKMPREPRISALAACFGLEGATDRLSAKFSATEWRIYDRLLTGGSSLYTSSVGRLFDAVASLLNLMDKATYEGEAALRLEQLAGQYFRHHGLEAGNDHYFRPGMLKDGQVATQTLLAVVLEDLRNGSAEDSIAARFHATLAQLVGAMARQRGIRRVCLSGGVFQNQILIDLIRYNLGKDIKLYGHQLLSPNDESISFGQLVYDQLIRRPDGGGAADSLNQSL